MPELPEVEALARFLGERATGRVVARLDVVAFNVLKTFDPPPTALHGLAVTGASRHGKLLDLDVDGLHLVVHFSRAGWAQWKEPAAAAPARPGKGPLALRVVLDDGEGLASLDLTEAGTQKRLAVHLVHDPTQVPAVAKLGPDPLTLDVDGLAERLAGTRQRLKTVLTDQQVLAGIGNAYSDDILHAARLSPFAPAGGLTAEELERLHGAVHSVLGDAVAAAVGRAPEQLKDDKRGRMRVHGRTGQACDVCGTRIAEISYTDSSFQYCPGCQTGGQVLSDRRMSRLLK
ncbi:Fpg/Nei family DNA glycosylase [Aquipuribacter sp. SD81]|uniref:Fpg/Nei family DNA glycosylase n=1 Tax=Aquipuribacter sp. SD81 TaxID=3127703 RepID=UPI00301AC461